MSSLADMHCAPTGQSAAKPLALSDIEVATNLKHLDGWAREKNEIRKTFNFKNYHETMAFVNASAWVSHREDHHPDMSVHYNRCVVAYSTHDADGITLNDFICAAKLDRLVAG
jgi:4a-hydroxytetrahydrobiopterin dehydratase